MDERIERNGGLIALSDLAAIAVLQACHHRHGQSQEGANELHELLGRDTLTALLRGAGIEMRFTKKKAGFSVRLEVANEGR